MKNQIVQDTVSNLITQAGIDEKFRPDFVKAVAAVYDAAHDAAAPVVESAPLTDAEIASFRDGVRLEIARLTDK